MNEIIYLIYNNTKKQTKSPTDYSDLVNIFVNEFHENKTTEFIFKFKDKNNQEQIINEDIKISDFKTGMLIYATEKEIEEKNFSPPPTCGGVKDEGEDENRKIEILERQYKTQINENKKLCHILNDKREIQSQLKEEIKKLETEFVNIENTKKVKKKKNYTEYELELNKLQESYDIKDNDFDKEIAILKKTNKNLKNKIEEIKLDIKQENETKNKLILEQNELLKIKEQIIIKLKKPKYKKTKKKIDYINKKLEKDKIIKKDKIKENVADMEKIKNEEETKKKNVFEDFRKKLEQIKKYRKLNLISNKGGSELEINSQLKKRKNILNEILLNLKKNKIKIENDYKLEIQNLSKKNKLSKIKEEIIKYEYECTNLLNLQQHIYVGTELAEIHLVLKNKGDHQWPKKETKLIFDKAYQLRGKNIELNPLNSNEEQNCVIKIEGLGKLPEGEYMTGVWFNVNGVNFGNMIKMKIIIKKTEVNPIVENMEKIKQFREEYMLREEDYSDDDLYNILLSNNFNFQNAFASLFGD